MRVLHAPMVIANQSVVLTEALREIGIEATSLQYHKLPLKFTADININIGRKRNLFKWFYTQLINFPRFYNNYDIYHFHYTKTLLPFFIDLPILKLLRKKIIFEYHGSDIRPLSRYSSSLSLIAKLDLLFNIKLTWLVSKFFVDKEIVSTPDLLEFVPSAEFIPVAVKKIENIDGLKKDPTKIVIVHAPTNRKIKGTSYIIDAVKKLKRKGSDIKLDLVEGLSKEEAKKRYEQADVAVDQILIGWYGLFAVELMSLGKPVVCYIRKDLEKFAPDLPLVNSTNEFLVGDIEKLIKDKKLREKLGEAGKTYVSENHDSMKIAKKLVRLYKSLSRRR